MDTLNLNKFKGMQQHISFKQRFRDMPFVSGIKALKNYIFLMLIAIMLGVATVYLGLLPTIVIIAIVVGLPIAYAMIIYPKFGIILFLSAGYMVMWVDKMGISYPTGTLMDAMQVLLIIGFFFKHKYDKSWAFAKNPISVIVLIWIVYSFLEVLNPIAASQLAWIYTVRTVAVIMLTYFIFIYHINSISFIRLIIMVWIGLSVFAALYSFKQEYFDFFPFEKKWLAANPVASSLYFIGGHWRKFSIFSDPVTSAYNMVISSLLCIVLLIGNTSTIKRIGLGFCSVLFFMAMLHTGTRGAFVLIPVGIILLLILKLNRSIILLSIIGGIAFLAVIRMPTSNATLSRFQSAFYPSHDASFMVRKLNQKRIQPYIQSHPLGGGLGSTGAWGQRFSPNSYLASFPPDSGYVRVAVEMGWIGLLLICILMFIVLKTGIENYFKIQDPELKNYCLAMVIIVFALCIGNYPQEALVQYPTNIYFCLIMALINITLRLDQTKTENDLHTFNAGKL